MKKKNGDNDKVVDLDQFRKEKFTLNIRVGGYYANLELGVYLHIVGVTSPMHTKKCRMSLHCGGSFREFSYFPY